MSLMPALLCGPLKNCPKIRAPKKVRTDGTNFSTAEPSFAGFYLPRDLGLCQGCAGSSQKAAEREGSVTRPIGSESTQRKGG